MDTASVAQPAQESRPNTRAARALKLFEERGSLIRAVAADTFEVPSCGMRGKRYTVRYGGSVEESCTCKDFEFNGGPCKHLIATALLFAARRCGVKEVRTISVAAGDPFYAEAHRDETPHSCYDGWVYLGFAGEDADGNPCEEIERVPCKRCSQERR